METTMIYGHGRPILGPDSLTASNITGATLSLYVLQSAERRQQTALKKNIVERDASARAALQLLYLSFDNRPEQTQSEQIFDAIRALYLSNNQPRDRQIADRMTALYRDAIAEEESVLANSVRQFTDFFLTHSDLCLPKITLTPDGTLRARWIHGPGSFVAIEFAGDLFAKLVAEIPRANGLIARHFSLEPVRNIHSIACAIGASFA